MKKRLKLLFLLLSILLALGSILLTPCFAVYGGGRCLMVMSLTSSLPLEISYIHSVQKTPVYENIIVSTKGFDLVSTRYQSFGVGSPFLASEGEFHQEGDFFIMKMSRHFKSLSLRTGVGTKHTITVRNKVCRLYEQLFPGEKVDLVIIPCYELLQRGDYHYERK